MQAAQSRHDSSRPERTTYVLIDEFYHIAGKSFGDLLSTVRGWGLRFILANQTPKQLEHHDPTLPDVIRGNTMVEQAFTLTPEDELYFREASGETLRMLQSASLGPYGVSLSVAPSREMELTDKDMKRANDTRLRSVVLIKRELPGCRRPTSQNP